MLTVFKSFISHFEEQSDLRIHGLVSLAIFCIAINIIRNYAYLRFRRIDVEKGCIKLGNILIQEMTALGMKLLEQSDV